MREIKLRLTPFELLTVVSFKAIRTVGQHARFTLSGHIQSAQETAYKNTSMGDTEVNLIAIDETGEQSVLFCGLLYDLKIKVDGDVRMMTIDVISTSFRMDCIKHTRVFQNAELPYEALLKHVEKPYPKSSHLMTVPDKAIGDLIVQYNETDWSFINRLASHFKTVAVPVYDKNGTNYYFGMPHGVVRTRKENDAYTIKKQARTYLSQIINPTDIVTETDSMAILLESREIYQLGDRIAFQDVPYVIYSIESELSGRELLHKYTLMTAEGIKAAMRYNLGAIGASLEATIVEVAKDTVKVLVHVDGIQKQGTAKWFSYSTVYSSPDGTGWYCMPEEGDSVRLYMPSERESEGYIISAVHLPSGGSGASGDRSTPDNKSLKSKYGKEVLFTPGTLVMTNNNGMSVQILDDEGIKIISDKAIIIESKAVIQVASTEESVSVVAPDAISLTQGETSLTIQDQIHLNGAQVHLE